MDGYKINEAALMLGVKVRTVREWIRLGKIRAEKSDNGWYWLIPRSEVERLNANKN